MAVFQSVSNAPGEVPLTQASASISAPVISVGGSAATPLVVDVPVGTSSTLAIDMRKVVYFVALQFVPIQQAVHHQVLRSCPAAHVTAASTVRGSLYVTEAHIYFMAGDAHPDTTDA